MRRLPAVAFILLCLAASASAQSIGGMYTVEGTNLDGSNYSGTAEIKLTSDTTCTDPLGDRRYDVGRHLLAQWQRLRRRLCAWRCVRPRRLQGRRGRQPRRTLDDRRQGRQRYRNADAAVGVFEFGLQRRSAAGRGFSLPGWPSRIALLFRGWLLHGRWTSNPGLHPCPFRRIPQRLVHGRFDGGLHRQRRDHQDDDRRDERRPGDAGARLFRDSPDRFAGLAPRRIAQARARAGPYVGGPHILRSRRDRRLSFSRLRICRSPTSRPFCRHCRLPSPWERRWCSAKP